ncbi:MAG: hypothetical protein E7368_02210 [Clostridiales bacterium]|nr:hypothetical protein [Clostridiales bacterium]
MKKNKSKKLLLWLTTGALATGFAVAALPTSFEEEYTASAATMPGEVAGTTFSDDFQKYTSYGTAVATSDGTRGTGGVRTTNGVGWTNQWFDGVPGETITYDQGCSNAFAEITSDPANSSNKVLYLKSTNSDFYYITPTKDGSPLVMKNYEISYKFKLASSTKAEEKRTAAPWFGTLNRKTKTGDESYDPADGRYNGTNSLLTALRAGVKPTDASTQKNYFFSFSLKFMYNSTTDVVFLGEKQASGLRGELDNCVYPDTVYDEWHVYKCVFNEDSVDIYLDGKHMGGTELGSGSGYNCVKDKGYVSIALNHADMYVDDVNIKEILPEPGVDGASEVSMRADSIKDAILTLVNTKSISAIKNGTEALAQSAYALSADGKTLTIKKSYLETLDVGSYTLTVTASDGTKNYDFDITIIITPIPGVDGASNEVTTRPTDDAVVALKNVSDIKSIKKDAEVISDNFYSFASNSLTIKADYVGILGVGMHEFIVDTNNGEFTLTLIVKNKPSVSGSTTAQIAQGETASFTLKNVDSISSVTENGTDIGESAWSYANNKITFSATYTASLTTGKHTYTIKTPDGDLTVNLRVKTASSDEDSATVDKTEASVKVGEDVVFTLTKVTSVNSIEVDTADGTKTLTANTDYTYENSILTIKSALFKVLGDGDYSFIVNVNDDAELDMITVAYHPATIVGSSMGNFTKNSTNGVSFSLENVESITKIKREKLLREECYSFEDNTLTLDASYLNSLSSGDHAFIITTDNGEVSVSVKVEGTVTLTLVIPEGSKASFANGEDGVETFVEGTATDIKFRVKGITSSDTIMIKVSETKKLVSTAYSYSNGELTIKGEYLATLKAGSKELTLVVSKSATSGGETPKTEEDDGGCGSSLGFASTMLAAAVVGGLAIARKKRK